LKYLNCGLIFTVINYKDTIVLNPEPLTILKQGVERGYRLSEENPASSTIVFLEGGN